MDVGTMTNEVLCTGLSRAAVFRESCSQKF